MNAKEVAKKVTKEISKLIVFGLNSNPSCRKKKSTRTILFASRVEREVTTTTTAQNA